MSANGAETMVDTLLDAGAKRCYGVVGDTINHFTDAIRRSDMDWVHVRHQEVGGFAAGGEAFVTGELACCAAAPAGRAARISSTACSKPTATARG